ncbi:hypothetical protein G3O08_05310 [Cryomorpha ignava]|uniref:Uncharacterized protein n=1 Tax=Cryomorpha ignava TaxID=101383 RepID=A0A7K3WQ81_9FLAO|nr:hypothetical protein [Cryomorpha ignava]NEN22915.1 hypothetical protein [Cryomorpha ignava]
MRIVKAFGFIAILVLVSACNETKYPNEIQTVDRLIAQIDSAQKIHAGIDTTGIKEGNRIFSQKFNFVKANYTQTADTLHRKEALLISNYRDLKKPYDRFNDQYSVNAKELEFSKGQLLDLRHDLEHNLLDTNFVKRMVESEIEATETVVAETKRLENGRKTMIEKNNELEPRIDSLINYIKTNP